MAKFLQPSLSGGELAPGLRGRVDLARYAVSLGKSRNFITKPTGGGVKRSGTRMCGRVKLSHRPTRLLPFIVSTDVAYVVEVGDGYMRFWHDGALVTNTETAISHVSQDSTAEVTAAGHGLETGDYVAISGVRGPDKVNGQTFQVTVLDANKVQLEGFDSSALPSYSGGGVMRRVVEIESPYYGDDVWKVRHTQSADVMFLFHPWTAPRELRRLATNQWEIRMFDYRRGPFRSFNADEAKVMAVSGETGIVSVYVNVDTFTDKMVGQLIYVEEKELRGVKPWASAEKNIQIGQKRRSDSKVYRCVGVPSSKGTAGTPYHVTGGVRPVHDVGRAFDGPQDIKFDGVNDYAVGVEWEFLHNTFGILEVTEYVDAREVKARVVERVPDSVVGKAQIPVAEWDHTGDGSTTQFDITGATSLNVLDYRVTIDGVPVQSNPSYPGGGGAGDGGGGPGPRPGLPPIYNPIE